MQNKLKPKHILLSTPTLRFSRSTEQPSLNFKSFDTPMVSPDSRLGTSPSQLQEEPQEQSKQNHTDQSFILLQQELNNCMHQTLTEQKRNATLTQLNNILKAANRQVEKMEKQVLKHKIDKERKRIQKEENQIQQVLQKHNEEVARITQLRQQVKAARTDRVVFSALFKKIQKEIKYHESMYQSLIIKSQTKILNKSKATEPDKDQNKTQSLDQVQHKQLNNNVSLNDAIDSKTFFLTGLQKGKQTINKRNTQRKQDVAKIILKQIDQLQSKIQRIVIDVQCSSAAQALQQYSGIQQQNEDFLSMIQETQLEIEQIQDQIQCLQLKRRNCQVVQQRHMDKLNSLPSTRKLRSYKTMKTITDAPSTPSIQQFIYMLAEKANLKDASSPLQTFYQLQSLLLAGEENRKSTSSEPNLEGMLVKMDRFDNCERIFSKDLFEGEYLKELAKQKKGPKPRK